MDPKLDANLQEILDKQEIEDLLMRYCRGIDRGEAELSVPPITPMRSMIMAT